MSERELVAAILGSWISGGIVIGVMMWLQELRWRKQMNTAERTIVQDELLRNIVKQTRAMQEIASELRGIRGSDYESRHDSRKGRKAMRRSIKPSYPKDMMQRAIDQNKVLVTIDIPGMTFKGPVDRKIAEMLTDVVCSFIKAGKKCEEVP